MYLTETYIKYCLLIFVYSYNIVCEVSCPRLSYNEPGTTYTVLGYPEDVHASVATIPTTLRFTARDCDPITGVPDAEQGYNDEYMVQISLTFLILRSLLFCRLQRAVNKSNKMFFSVGRLGSNIGRPSSRYRK